MRTLLLALILVALVAGCSTKADTGTAQPAAPGAVASASDETEWFTTKSTSGIDGDTVFASRMFSFPDKQTTFRVSVFCPHNSKMPGMSIESFVGDTSSPNIKSRFATTIDTSQGVIDHAPKGRMKYSDENDPTDLGLLFGVNSTYANRIDLKGMWIRPISGVNNKSSLRFPMVVELTNGEGVFELDIASSPEVEQVLVPCADSITTITQEAIAAQDQADLAKHLADRAKEEQDTADHDAAVTAAIAADHAALRARLAAEHIDIPADDTTVAQPALSDEK